MSSFQMFDLSGERDERGLVSLQIPFHADDLSEFLSYGASNPFGLPEVKRGIKRLETGGYQITVTFEGIDPDEDPEGEGTYELDSSFREEPIEAFPGIETIKRDYGGYEVEGKIKFPSTIPAGSSSGSGLVAKNKGENAPNPYYGMTTYRVMHAIFRHTYIRKTIPSSIFDRAGTTANSLPGGFPTPSGRNWLYQPPKMRRRGDVFEISEELMLSKPGAVWPEAIYSLIQR